MLGEEERAKSIDLKGGKGVGMVNLGRAFLWVQNTGYAEAEAEVAV